MLRRGLDTDLLDGAAPADVDLDAILDSTEAVADLFFDVMADLGLDGASDTFLTFGADIANDGVLNGAVAQGVDFGVDPLLAARAAYASGFERGGDFHNPTQAPEDIVQIANGLNLALLTRNAANHWDMMAFWPLGDNPTHLVGCIETGRALNREEDGRYNPSVQTIAITGENKGEVRTVLRGMDRCDCIRTTPLGTILATEETGDGSAYEILNPLTVTDVFIADRGAPGEVADIREANGDAHDSSQVVKRPVLPTMAWEGLMITEQGVVIAGDELRPGTAADDVDGGAIFKFIPTNPRTPGAFSADANGNFEILVEPGVQGVVVCYPPGLADLSLRRYFSTVGMAAGDALTKQDVRPETTVAYLQLIAELEHNPNLNLDQRADELHEGIGADAPKPAVAVLIKAAAALYDGLLEKGRMGLAGSRSTTSHYPRPSGRPMGPLTTSCFGCP